MRTGLIALTAGTLLAGAAAAQDVIIERQGPGDLLGDWLIGAAVDSAMGERIGAIDDVIIDPDDGRLTAAIVSVGGFLGFGAKSIAVEWDAFAINRDAQEIVLNLTRAEMEDAATFEFRDREVIPVPQDLDGGGALDGGGGTMGGGGIAN